MLLVMLKNALVVAFLNIPNPVVAFTGLKKWSRRVITNKIDLYKDSSYSQIIPHLYLSNAHAALDLNVLQDLKITHILTIEAHRLPKSVISSTGVTTLFIRAYDSPQTHLMPYFPMANAFIEEGIQKGNVLVHCHFGVSRSATLVIAFVMQKFGIGFEEAFHRVKQKRPFINPNVGFISQLRDYEKLHYDVHGFYRFEAYMNVHARKHKYKIASLAAVMVGIFVPLAVLVG